MTPDSSPAKSSAAPPRKKWWVGVGGGIAVLLLLGSGYAYLRGIFRAIPEYALTQVPALDDPQFSQGVVGLSNAVTTTGQMTGFWREVDDIYAARNAAIRQAKSLIQFETYFMTEGRRAHDFAEALRERAAAGVRVQLLLDHQGTQGISPEYWRRLQDAGIEVQFFREPDWRTPLEYNSRSHRKLLLIDGQQAFIGGAGVSDYWDGIAFDHDVAPWLEFEVAYAGEVVRLLQGKFLQNWAYAGGDLNLSRDINQQVMPAAASAGVTLYITDDTSTLNESSIRMLVQLSILAAQNRLWIGSPYFVPDSNTRRALVQARENKVDVRILTMSGATDKRFVHLASRELYGELLAAGIPICEYQPSMMHAKFILADTDWVSTGSANFDPRSYFHNDELNISGFHPQLAQEIEAFFLDALADSQCLTEADWQQRPFIDKIRGNLALLFKNLL